MEWEDGIKSVEKTQELAQIIPKLTRGVKPEIRREDPVKYKYYILIHKWSINAFSCKHLIHKISFIQILKGKQTMMCRKQKELFRKCPHRYCHWSCGRYDKTFKMARIPVKGKIKFHFWPTVLGWKMATQRY